MSSPGRWDSQELVPHHASAVLACRHQCSPEKGFASTSLAILGVAFVLGSPSLSETWTKLIPDQDCHWVLESYFMVHRPAVRLGVASQSEDQNVLNSMRYVCVDTREL